MKARDYYEKAATQGHVRAMHNLAVIEAEGVEGKPDYAGAAQWFHRAADYGVRDSQFNLAILYARGMGVSQNLGQSYVWFDIAARQGDEDAARKRDEIAARLDAATLEAARKQASDFHARSPVAAVNDPPSAPTHAAAAFYSARRSGDVFAALRLSENMKGRACISSAALFFECRADHPPAEIRSTSAPHRLSLRSSASKPRSR